MGEGVDPHLYKGSPRDVRDLAGADLVFAGGLHLEGKLIELAGPVLGADEARDLALLAARMSLAYWTAGDLERAEERAEFALDIAEGADSVMVKPGLAYLDIIYRVKQRFDVPVFAYQVSGEYAMIEAAQAAGIGDRDALVLEKLIAFKRAGCNGVLTYHAAHVARLLNG